MDSFAVSILSLLKLSFGMSHRPIEVQSPQSTPMLIISLLADRMEQSVFGTEGRANFLFSSTTRKRTSWLSSLTWTNLISFTRAVLTDPWLPTICSKKKGFRCAKPKTVSILQWVKGGITSLNSWLLAQEALSVSGTATRLNLSHRSPIPTRLWISRSAQAVNLWLSELKLTKSTSTACRGLINLRSWARDSVTLAQFRDFNGALMKDKLFLCQPTVPSQCGTFSVSRQPNEHQLQLHHKGRPPWEDNKHMQKH